MTDTFEFVPPRQIVHTRWLRVRHHHASWVQHSMVGWAHYRKSERLRVQLWIGQWEIVLHPLTKEHWRS